MAETGRVFIWVQHLFGIGPLMRAAHIARFLSGRGWDVDLVSGGPPVRGLDVGSARLHQLPPVRAADATYSRLVYVDGKPLDAALEATRRDLLLRLFAGADPHILMFEQFPFGRARFRFEIGPLLIAAAKSATRPAIVASIREILAERPPEDEARTAAVVEQVFDSVLVHGDPRLFGLEASFGAVPRIAEKLAYTGYVGGTGAAIKLAPGIGTNEIVVASGSGAFGARLAAIAVDAAKTMQYVRRWRILLDSGAGPRAFRKLGAQAPEWATVEPLRPNLRTILSRCSVSVSQAGYNTVVDVLAAGCRAVLVPLAEDREQVHRAETFARRGLARVMPDGALSPGLLASVVTEAMDAPKSIRKVKIDGEVTTERILSEILAERRQRSRA